VVSYTCRDSKRDIQRRRETERETQTQVKGYEREFETKGEAKYQDMEKKGGKDKALAEGDMKLLGIENVGKIK
jgi:hypothetical protein